MTPEYSLLLTTALTLGVLHTAIGVDHTLPFVVLGRARRWTLSKTLMVTALCGVGHVLSSVSVGAIGWALGVTTSKLEVLEAYRGELAGLMLILFGSVYAAFGFWRYKKNQHHQHFHVHPDGTIHSHSHHHPPVVADAGQVMHRHPHAGRVQLGADSRLLPALFIIFVLGPCEALIPLMFAPTLGGELWMSWSIAIAFSLATLCTMLALVAAGYWGLSGKKIAKLAPHMNWGAGVLIALSGVGIRAFGL